tara:strand:- start:1175 stop:1399 length:225 start_codon:yes stop_codon:yes gene_type:complete
LSLVEVEVAPVQVQPVVAVEPVDSFMKQMKPLARALLIRSQSELEELAAVAFIRHPALVLTELIHPFLAQVSPR